MKNDTEKETLSEERRLEISRGLKSFKVKMMRSMPFFGDIMMRLPVVVDDDIPTACTNGRIIRYSPIFFNTLTEGQRNYVMLHEVMHVLLLHTVRRGSRRPFMWNIACDFMVNDMLDLMSYDIRDLNIPFERPEKGCFNNSFIRNRSAESVYAQLVKENKEQSEIRYCSALVTARPEDLEESDEQDADAIEVFVGKLLQNAKKYAERGKDHYIPRELLELKLTESRRLPWNKLLIDHLREREDEESSYMTPERKYIHMDMIIPGCGKLDDELGEIWAFIDSSGSITDNDMNQFVTQLCRIANEFHGSFNIAFWDVSVSDVYRNISTADQILKCIPRSTGGTNINCIYSYLEENRIKPELMLILTDGYFGELILKPGRLKKQTILVLSDEGCGIEKDNCIGRTATL